MMFPRVFMYTLVWRLCTPRPTLCIARPVITIACLCA